MFIHKNPNVFEKKCQEYFVLFNSDHNAVFMFHNDVEKVWLTLKDGIHISDIVKKLHDSQYDISEEELKTFLIFFAKLGIVRTENIQEDEELIKQNNQYSNYIDYCCSVGKPTVLHIETTNSCNLKCLHCFHDEEKSNLTLEDLTRVFDELSNTSFVRVTLTGGEIKFHPQWKEILSTATAKGFAVAILSNLTEFNESDLDYIVGMRPLFVRTSVYGATQKTHDCITGVDGSFEATIRNALYLKARGIDTRVSCSIMKHNYREIEELQKIMNNYSLPLEFGYQLFPSRKNTKDVDKMMIDESEFQCLVKKGILTPSNEAECNPGTYRIAIDQKGNIFSCDSLRISIGNIKKDTIFEALNSEKMKEIKSAVSAYFPENCKSCKNVQRCFRCPGLVWNYAPFSNEHSKLHCLFTNLSNFQE